jgi:hypothetical protein
MFLKFKTAKELTKIQGEAQSFTRSVRDFLSKKPQFNNLKPTDKIHIQVVFVMFFTSRDNYKYHPPEEIIQIVIDCSLNHDFITMQEQLNIEANVLEIFNKIKEELIVLYNSLMSLAKNNDRSFFDNGVVNIISTISAATTNFIRTSEDITGT